MTLFTCWSINISEWVEAYTCTLKNKRLYGSIKSLWHPCTQKKRYEICRWGCTVSKGKILSILGSMYILGVNVYISGANMYILSVDMYIWDTNMYILGANIYISGANTFQVLICTFQVLIWTFQVLIYVHFKCWYVHFRH